MEHEQQIQMLEAERALVEQKAQIEQQRLTHEAALQRAHFEHEQLIQQQENTLKADALEVDLALQLQTEQAVAEREAIAQQTQHRQAELGVEIKRLQQEVRNLVSEEALLQEWIHRLPQLAESMPDVQEMRVLQMGAPMELKVPFLPQQESIFSTLRQFLGRDKPSNTND